MLNILGLLDNPSGGSYELMGQEVAQLKERDRTKFRKGNIGFVFQSFNLIDELNVFENVELPLKYLNMSASERKQRVTAMLKRMNISHRAQHFPQQLSGGQQQRVAIARAVISGIGRRADRKPGFQERKRSNGLADGTEFGRNNDCNGNALAEGCFRGSANHQLV